jgi:tetratricopeptide (TPR) repeat protein
MLTKIETNVFRGDYAARIRAALERVVSSATLSNSPQLVSFLRFVVEEALAGRGERLKAYTIATAALGRTADFDPQSDPIVRVEATRLRAMLARYYEGPGRDDPVMIEIARGSYVPTFKDRPAPGPDKRAAGFAERCRTIVRTPLASVFVRRYRLAALTAALAFAGCIAAYLLWPDGGEWQLSASDSEVTRTGSPTPAETIESRLPPGPLVAIAPIDTFGTPTPPAITPAALLVQLCDAFARFDDVNIVASEAQCSGRNVSRPAGSSRPRGDYSFGATIDYHPDGSVDLRFRLIDAATSTVVWLSSVNRLGVSHHPELIAETIGKLATTLFQPFGIVQARERVKFAAGSGGDPRYRCLLQADDYLHSFNPQLHDAARECLEAAIARDPGFASGYVQLARVYFREYQFGYGERTSATPAIERARRAANRAAELKPMSARVHFVLADIALASGDNATAREESEKSLALNPYDMPVVFHYGANILLAGDIDRGLAIIDRIAATSTVPPGRVYVMRFVAAYLKGDLQAASEYANQIKDKADFGRLARALLAAKSGDSEQVKEAFRKLIAAQPAWQRDAKGELRKFFPALTMVERLAGDLSAGLDAAN